MKHIKYELLYVNMHLIKPDHVITITIHCYLFGTKF